MTRCAGSSVGSRQRGHRPTGHALRSATLASALALLAGGVATMVVPHAAWAASPQRESHNSGAMQSSGQETAPAKDGQSAQETVSGKDGQSAQQPTNSTQGQQPSSSSQDGQDGGKSQQAASGSGQADQGQPAGGTSGSQNGQGSAGNGSQHHTSSNAQQAGAGNAAQQQAQPGNSGTDHPAASGSNAGQHSAAAQSRAESIGQTGSEAPPGSSPGPRGAGSARFNPTPTAPPGKKIVPGKENPSAPALPSETTVTGARSGAMGTTGAMGGNPSRNHIELPGTGAKPHQQHGYDPAHIDLLGPSAKTSQGAAQGDGAYHPEQVTGVHQGGNH